MIKQAQSFIACVEQSPLRLVVGRELVATSRCKKAEFYTRVTERA